MRAERFGSYSIAATFAGTPSLIRLKSMIAVAPLVAAALVARRDAPVVVAAALAGDRLEQALLGLRLGDVVEGRDRHLAAARRRRLEALDRH